MYPEIPVLSFISAALTLVPLIWYLRARNIAAVAIGIWLLATNSTYAIDALVWAENTHIKAVVWCDIATAVITGSHIALPAACLSICIHLERLASFSSQISTPQAKRRQIVFECLMCIGSPIVYIALHLVVQPRRFDLFYGLGCRPATYPTVATIFLVVIPPLLLIVATIVYAGIAWRHFIVHGVQFYGKRGSISSLTRNLYLRLVGMALLEAVLSAVSIAVVMRGILSPELASVRNTSRHLSEVLIWGPEAITASIRTMLQIEWSVTAVQSVVFFGLFACRMEVVREGWQLITSFLRLLRKSNLSVRQGAPEQSESSSATVPTLPISVVDLSLVIRSSSTLSPYDPSMNKSLPSTPDPSCPPTPAEHVGPMEDEAVISTIDSLESPSRFSTIASSHNSLGSHFDPSQLCFSPDAWPQTPATISIRLPRRSFSVGHVVKQDEESWYLPESAVHVRSRTTDLRTELPRCRRQGIFVTVVKERQ